MAEEAEEDWGEGEWTGEEEYRNVHFPPWSQGFGEGEGYDGWEEDWEPPVVYVDASNRNKVEAFAKQMESLGVPEDCESSEYLPYCRMDASALLIHLANEKPGLLEKMQAAIMSKDADAFTDALSNAFGVLSRDAIRSIRTACEAGDKEALAEWLRSLAEEGVAGLMQEAEEGAQTAREVGNATDPPCGTERRCKVDEYLTTWTLPEGVTTIAPIPPDPHRNNKDAIAYWNISLGDDAASWEQQQLFHPYVYDGCNAASDLMQESRGVGFLDGRTVGLRGQGIGILG
jgi:hypothetical protein